MLEYVANLRKETDEAIDRIESSDFNILKKSLEASHLLGEAFNRIKSLSPPINSRMRAKR